MTRTMGAVALLMLALGCSGGQSDADATASDSRIPMPVDASADADLRDATPGQTDDGGVLLLGPGLVLNEVRLAESGHSWAGWAPLVNPQFETAINDGQMIILIELRGLDDPSGQNDDDIELGIYTGVDTDGLPSDNFNGSEMLRVSAASLDSLNRPRALLGNGSITNGQLTGSIQGQILFFLPTIGTVKIQDPEFSAELVAAGDDRSVVEMQNGVLSGVLLARHLEEVPNPVASTCLASSMLDLVSLPCLSFDGVQPDVDRDGDGLETFDEVAGSLDGQIDVCVDGDGTSYASTGGVQCVLDPAFQDAFTATIEVAGVRAILLPPL